MFSVGDIVEFTHSKSRLLIGIVTFEDWHDYEILWLNHPNPKLREPLIYDKFGENIKMVRFPNR